MKGLKIVAIGVCLALGSACAQKTQKVERGFDGSVDFSQFRTYQWVPLDEIPLAVAQPRIPLEVSDAKIRSALEERLNRTGLRHQMEGQADLLVNYFGAGRARLELSDPPYDDSNSYGVARVVTGGTLMVDLVDARKGQMVWRGWASEVFTEPEEFDQKLAEALDEMFKDFPLK